MNTNQDAALPPYAQALGYAGLIPLVGCALALLASGDPQLRHVAERVLVGYGAVILAFLGGVHWGLVLRERSDRAATMLAVGVVPALAGVASTFMAFEMAVVVQVAVFGGLWFYENRVLGPETVPAAYLALRRWLTLAVIAALGLALLSSALVRAHPQPMSQTSAPAAAPSAAMAACAAASRAIGTRGAEHDT